MNYNIINIPDIHWGVIDPIKQEELLEFIIVAIEKISERMTIHLLCIPGDYFDFIMYMSSTDSITSVQWFDRLFETCKNCGVEYIRMIRGTKGHDGDQMEHFRKYENKDNNYFRLFTETTTEKLYDDLDIIYCPDETVSTDEYFDRTYDMWLSGHDIALFHGNFDIVLPVEIQETIGRGNVVYKYDFIERCIRGPILGGHWHRAMNYKHLYYAGSPLCCKFDEEEDKGILFTRYNTETHQYYAKNIINILSPKYLTVDVYSNLLTSVDDLEPYLNTMNAYLEKYNDVGIRGRIKVYITDEKDLNDTFIKAFKHYYINEDRVKIATKNKIKDKKKKEMKQEIEKRNETYGFIYDTNIEVDETIQKFIFERYGVTIPISFINDKVIKYRK